MIQLTANAQARLDRYLHELRSILRGCRSVDSMEVERDVIEHIQTSLANAAVPVDEPILDGVLRELGEPVQWIPAEEVPWHRRLLVRAREAGQQSWALLRTLPSRLAGSPERYRLAYLSFGMLGLAAVVLAVEDGNNETPLPLVFLLLAFCLSRAALSAAVPEGLHPAQKWLVYPALVAVYVPLLMILLLWTIVASFGIVDLLDPRRGVITTGFGAAYGVPVAIPVIPLTIYMLLVLNTFWWAGVSLVAWLCPALVRNTFAPFADNFTGRRCLWIAMSFLALFLAAAIGGGWLLTKTW